MASRPQTLPEKVSKSIFQLHLRKVMNYFWSPDAVGVCLGCLIEVLSGATNSFTYLHYNLMELGQLRVRGQLRFAPPPASSFKKEPT